MIRFLLILLVGIAGLVTWSAPDPERQLSRATRFADVRGPEPWTSLPGGRTEYDLDRIRIREGIVRGRLAALDEIDRFVPELLRRHSEGQSLWIEATSDADPSYVEALELRFSDQGVRPNVAVGLVARVDSSYTAGRISDARLMAGRAEDGREWCLQVVTVSSDSPRTLTAWPRRPESTWNGFPRRYGEAAQEPLGVCSWVAQYGLPGPRVLDWIQHGAHAHATSSEPRLFDRASREVIAGVAAGPLLRPGLRLEFGFLFRDPEFGIPARGCAAGWDDLCREVLRVGVEGRPPLMRQRSGGLAPVYVPGQSTYFAYRNARTGSAFATLEAEFGSGAFEAFWTSDAPVEEAFEAAFGRPLSDWLRGRILGEDGSLRFGPAPGRAEWATSLFWASLLLFLGMLVQRRRRV